MRAIACAMMLIFGSAHAFADDGVCARMQAKAKAGRASWYAPALEGRPTSSGESYKPDAMTAAHPTLPLGTRVKVTNRRNGLSAILRINDRGPFSGDVIDLSEAAAAAIGAKQQGHAPVRIKVLCPKTE